MADAADSQVTALAKIGRLLVAPRASAKRVESERKQAAVIGQGRGADDEREGLEALAAALAQGGSGGDAAAAALAEAGATIRARLAELDAEAAQRRTRRMKLRIAAESDSDSSEEDGDGGLEARAVAAAAAVSAEKVAAASPEAWLKRSLLAFVHQVLCDGDASAASVPVPPALSPGGVLLDPAYWLALVPQGSAEISGAPLPLIGAARAADVEGARATFAARGFILAPSSWPPDADAALGALPGTMAALVAAGWPPAFCFVFDAPWRALAALVGWGEQVLGEGVRMEPSIFAWRLQRQRQGFAGSNFGLPHRDYSHSEAHDEQGCRLLSVWVPLTDVGVDDGCMYVVGKDFDADFDKPQRYAHLRPATAARGEQLAPGAGAGAGDEGGAGVTELRFPISGVRPLAPAPAKSVCAWAGNSIHYGASASAASARPRQSIAVTLCAARVESLEGCSQLLSGAALLELTLAQRLAFISRSLVSHSRWFEVVLPELTRPA